jgi:hypothetical protein
MTSTRLFCSALLCAVFAVCAAVPAFADEYEDYAKWWRERSKTKKDWVIRGDDGKRKYKMFYRPLNPPAVSAERAEEAGMVQDPTFVLGVTVGGQSRAYPLHSIGELINDTLGGAAIAATW